MKSELIPAPAMLGMLGGGQLGRFFVIAAHEMGYQVTVLDPTKDSPAGKIADVHICASYDDPAALAEMGKTCAAITTEFENVPAETLATLAESAVVRPSAASVAIAQHRVLEKNFIKEAGLPLAPFTVIDKAEDLPEDDSSLYPAILKVARFGYDGKGQARVKTRVEALSAFDDFKQEACVLEKMMPLDLEVSVVLVRSAQGEVTSFLDISIAPARCSDVVKARAQGLAGKLATALDYVGVLAVEFFLVGQDILVNEIAPRPHNSGHYTIDACVSSQFEQQVRALVGFPVGSTALHSKAVMVNVLGDSWVEGVEPAWGKAFAHNNLKLHLYGKPEARKGRKMGHFTVIDKDQEAALNAALIARSELNIGL
ncbi:MAG TPA: 5-(carboxyamino)imidazole ribonucleotide synthase [Methylophilaceae bacterium]|nr:5-(carboxyamino)imidazole ribonucleotide synthase [Methylophilaceae bacterium]